MSAETERLDAHWGQEAASYDEIMGADPAMRGLLAEVLARVPPSPQAVLDLGTGTGALLHLIARHHAGCRLVGLDPAPAMLEVARRKLGRDPRVSFVHGSAERLDFPAEVFDVIVSNFALHHLTHSGKASCAREAFRVLVPGGRFIFGDQHCMRMGAPDDLVWLEDMFDLLCAKSRHYLRTAGAARMLLQIRMMPRFLTCDGEIPATVAFWEECLTSAGFEVPTVLVVEPELLLHRVIVATKPAS